MSHPDSYEPIPVGTFTSPRSFAVATAQGVRSDVNVNEKEEELLIFVVADSPFPESTSATADVKNVSTALEQGGGEDSNPVRRVTSNSLGFTRVNTPPMPTKSFKAEAGSQSSKAIEEVEPTCLFKRAMSCPDDSDHHEVPSIQRSHSYPGSLGTTITVEGDRSQASGFGLGSNENTTLLDPTLKQLAALPGKQLCRQLAFFRNNFYTLYFCFNIGPKESLLSNLAGKYNVCLIS